eukprot:TRINITY_DN1694_c0_g1_i1.p1 TRINITY_DN1694_c0_g1~~TRINITY_DN1694_c0_g1_i1.p1  ORF type:complete len:131 (+),score=40.42 TRINITY_DN1694_c0_g1_i1:38-394(+)
MTDFIPAIVVANGQAREGTLVQVMQDGEWQKGKVTQMDFPASKVHIALDNGETAVVDAPEVHRQKPQLAPQATADAKSTPQPTQATKAECKECQGQGQRKGLLGKKSCKSCKGTGNCA